MKLQRHVALHASREGIWAWGKLLPRFRACNQISDHIQNVYQGQDVLAGAALFRAFLSGRSFLTC